MAKQALYALSEGEKVIFELNIDDFAKPEKTGFFGALIDTLGEFAPLWSQLEEAIFGAWKPEGILVFTNARCFISIRKTRRGAFGITKEEKRDYITFPRKAITEWNSYEKDYSRKCCCCATSKFVISIGLDGKDEPLTFTTHEIKTDEEAQAVIAKIVELSQNA